jgi:hypothetical protein
MSKFFNGMFVYSPSYSGCDGDWWVGSPSTPPLILKTKSNLQEISIEIFEKMVDISIGLMKFFKRTNELQERVDHQFDRLINKL